MQTKQEWTVSDISNPVRIRGNECNEIEFQDNAGEWHHFLVIVTKDRVVFGGACNVGFIESGFIMRDEGESIDEALQEMLSDLECYYNDGPQYVSRIVFNERM